MTPTNGSPVSGVELALSALRLADDVLSRSPNSTRIWITDDGEVHPAKGISLIRGAIEALSRRAVPMEAVAWRVRANRNHPLVEHDPFPWRLSETKPALGEGAEPEWFDVQALALIPQAEETVK